MARLNVNAMMSTVFNHRQYRWLHIKSGRGLPHSKTLRGIGRMKWRASVLECASPLALWQAKVLALKRCISLIFSLVLAGGAVAAGGDASATWK